MRLEKATFAAGCFWGVERAFRQMDGVTDAACGYTGGHYENPTYEDVCSGQTGHAEAVKLTFDADRTSYKELLEAFWQMHDPTTLNRQGPDRVPDTVRRFITTLPSNMRRRWYPGTRRMSNSLTPL